ncbi:MAG: tetratricopeptide repeat protein [Acidobacteria bacterium]|nr:tetratricopeptide repeat protein [Acidobacteriota bacterium]
MTLSPRRQMLETFVAAHPNDAFARYGLAMECVGSGELELALEHFEKLVAANPNYVPSYYHYGQLLARLEKPEEAKQVLRTGMEVAKKAGDFHALSELEQSLNDLA